VGADEVGAGELGFAGDRGKGVGAVAEFEGGGEAGIEEVLGVIEAVEGGAGDLVVGEEEGVMVAALGGPEAAAEVGFGLREHCPWSIVHGSWFVGNTVGLCN
jgi:hypothetical protein